MINSVIAKTLKMDGCNIPMAVNVQEDAILMDAIFERNGLITLYFGIDLQKPLAIKIYLILQTGQILTDNHSYAPVKTMVGHHGVFHLLELNE